MTPRIVDPYDDPHFAEGVVPGPRAGDIVLAKPKAPAPSPKATTSLTKAKDPYDRDPILVEDFREFMAMLWEYLGLPPPSAVQLALAWWLQHGPNRAIILGFRGMAKSWITGAYILWTLYRNPQKKIMVVSASEVRAVGTVQWCLQLIRVVPELRFLEPEVGAPKFQRASGHSFDVGPATPDQSPSLIAKGINGQLAGSRAHLIVPDDVEIPANSMTTLMREKIAEAVKEFDAILHPGGEIKFLGTPQVDDSLYVKLQLRGYECRIWPARFPDIKMRAKYGQRLSPWVVMMLDQDPTLVGKSVWPDRFPDSDLADRELSYGRSGFALQFMLDTSLADAERYPLKLRDLIVDDIDAIFGPEVIAWSNAPEKVINDLAVMGFEGDRFYRPASRSEALGKYNSIKGALDPSGRGTNQTALTIGGELNGRLFHFTTQGWLDGYAPATLKAIADLCVRYRVQELMVEDNYGDGMFVALLSPVMHKAWEEFNRKVTKEELRGGTDILAVKSPKTQKELRILSVLEPASQQHRVVISRSAVDEDQQNISALVEDVGNDTVHSYSLWHQWTHLSREKDCLLQDDKLESFAMWCSLYSDLMGIDPWVVARSREQDRIEEEYEEMMRDAIAVSEGWGDPDDRPPSNPGWNRAKQATRPN